MKSLPQSSQTCCLSVNVRRPVPVLVPGLGSPHFLSRGPDDLASQVILRQDVAGVRLGESLQDGALRHEGTRVDELLQYAGVWLLGQGEVESAERSDGELCPGELCARCGGDDVVGPVDIDDPVSGLGHGRQVQRLDHGVSLQIVQDQEVVLGIKYDGAGLFRCQAHTLGVRQYRLHQGSRDL